MSCGRCPDRLWDRATRAERRGCGPRSSRPQRAERPPRFLHFIVADRCSGGIDPADNGLNERPSAKSFRF